MTPPISAALPLTNTLDLATSDFRAKAPPATSSPLTPILGDTKDAECGLGPSATYRGRQFQRIKYGESVLLLEDRPEAAPLTQSPMVRPPFEAGDGELLFKRSPRPLTNAVNKTFGDEDPRTQALFLKSAGVAAPRTAFVEMLLSVDPHAYMNQIVCKGVPEELYISRLPHDKASYWSFIMQRKISLSISLSYCSFYLLSKEEPRHITGDFLIQLIEERQDKGLCQRRFQITHVPTGVERPFTHLSLEWFDGNTPTDEDFTSLMRIYLHDVANSPKPAVHIHCIGGHGRSGTLLLTRALMAQPAGIIAEELLDSLRSQRARLVETERQFHFAIHHASALSKKVYRTGGYPSSKLMIREELKPRPKKFSCSLL